MEIIISVALFSVIILSATEIFKMVIDSQRTAIATQNVQESLKYFLEVIGKEIRMAQDSKGACGIPTGSIFKVTALNATSDSLTFKNRYNECVIYSLGVDGTNQRFVISRAGTADYISPAKIMIDSLHFVLTSGTTKQPMVTINLRAHALDQKFKSDMTIQTSMTSRYYKN